MHGQHSRGRPWASLMTYALGSSLTSLPPPHLMVINWQYQPQRSQLLPPHIQEWLLGALQEPGYILQNAGCASNASTSQTSSALPKCTAQQNTTQQSPSVWQIGDTALNFTKPLSLSIQGIKAAIFFKWYSQPFIHTCIHTISSSVVNLWLIFNWLITY